MGQTSGDSQFTHEQALADAESPEEPLSARTPKGKLREVSLRQGTTAGTIFITIRIKGGKVNAVLDTAAQITVVSQHPWSQFRRRPQVQEKFVLRLCGGTATNSKMEALVVFEMQPQR